MVEPVFEAHHENEEFTEMIKYIHARKQEEFEKIMFGLNKEVEKRYERYVNY